MSRRRTPVLLILPALAALLLLGAGSTAPAAAQSCNASASWITNPSIPTEVAGGENADNCAFHQLAWQTFLAVVQEAASGELVFETWMPDYGVFVTSGTPVPWGQEPTTPCTGDAPNATGRWLRARTAKLTSDAVNPNETLQATGDPLYDQASHLVYYESWVNQTEYDFITNCQLYNNGCIQAAPVNIALPPGSIEIKTAWRILSGPSEQFYTVQGLIGSSCQPVTLGLVGFHLVMNTPDHPEFIWATFEQQANAPDCPGTGVTPPAGGWSFFDPNCTSGGQPCATNQTNVIPTQVCRVNPYGAGSAQNTANIVSLNQSVSATLQKVIAIDPQKYGDMAVWLNYGLTGNLWTNMGELPPTSGSSGNERGSLLNANTTMETFAQSANCFDCHTMGGAFQQQNPNSNAVAGFSHLFFEAAQSGGCNSGAGPLPAACPAAPAKARLLPLPRPALPAPVAAH